MSLIAFWTNFNKGIKWKSVRMDRGVDVPVFLLTCRISYTFFANDKLMQRACPNWLWLACFATFEDFWILLMHYLKDANISLRITNLKSALMHTMSKLSKFWNWEYFLLSYYCTISAIWDFTEFTREHFWTLIKIRTWNSLAFAQLNSFGKI